MTILVFESQLKRCVFLRQHTILVVLINHFVLNLIIRIILIIVHLLMNTKIHNAARTVW